MVVSVLLFSRHENYLSRYWIFFLKFLNFESVYIFFIESVSKVWQLSYYIIFHDVPLNQILFYCILCMCMCFSSTWKFLTYIDILWENDLLDLFMCWLWWIFMILLPVTKIKITSLYPSLSLDSKRLVLFFFSFFSCFYSLSFQFMWKNTQILWWLSFSTDKPFCCQS